MPHRPALLPGILFGWIFWLGTSPSFSQAPLYQDTLANGLRVVYLHDTSRPLIEAALLRETNPRPETSATDGLHLLLAQTFWDRGPDTLNYTTYAQRRGIRTEGWHQDGRSYLYYRCRPHQNALAISILRAALSDAQYPESDQKRVARNYAQLLQRLEVDPAIILDQQVLRNLWDDEFPAAHPYGSFVAMQSLPRKEVGATHDQIFRRAAGELLLTGPVPPPQLMRELDSLLVGWEALNPPPPAPLAVDRLPLPDEPYALLVNDLALAPRIQFAWRLQPEELPWARTFVSLANVPGSPFYQQLVGDSLATAFRWEIRQAEVATLTVWMEPLPDQVAVCGQRLRSTLDALGENQEAWKKVQEQEAEAADLWAAGIEDEPKRWMEAWGREKADLSVEELLERAEAYFEEKPVAGAAMISSEWEGRVTLDEIFGAPEMVVQVDTPEVEVVEPQPVLPDYSWLDSIKIYFESGSNQADMPSLTRIDRVAALLRSNDTLAIHVNGYTDGLGDGVTNLALSRERAEAVKRIFVDQYEIASDRLEVVAWGEAFPEYPDDTPAHRALNRRVTFDIVRDETTF